MNVLSLFDGMSCGRIALERAGIPVTNYFAAEIDKYVTKVLESNYPDIIRLGDVENWREWDLPKIDLILAGSPCQGFSFAGAQLAFDDPRSRLFFTFVDILSEYAPKYFLLENVKMKKQYQDIISEQVGVEPVEINSALVSAQNRKRLYWANFKISQPEDKRIMLKDIIESDCVDRDKSQCLDANYYNGGWHMEPKILQRPRGKNNGGLKSGKCPTISANSFEQNNFLCFPCDIDKMHLRKLTPLECERLQTVPDNYTNHVSNTQRYKMLGNGWTVEVIAHILKGIKEAGERP